MTDLATLDWQRVRIMESTIDPTLTSKLSTHIRSTVQDDGTIPVDEIDNTFVLDSEEIPPGTDVDVAFRNRHVHCRPTVATEREEKKKKADMRAEYRDHRLKKERRQQRRREFWDDYDIPIEFTTGQNNRLGELSKGSTGTGATSSTVIHFLVLESFTDGRLERAEGSFLCGNEGKYSDPSMGLEGVDDQDPQKEITCSTCLKRMERWEVSDA